MPKKSALRTLLFQVWTVVSLLVLCSVATAAPRVPLIDAVKEGNATGVRDLLRKGAEVNTPEVDGTTALHWAVYRDNDALVELLLQSGANAKAANRYGTAPLSLACTNGNATIVERLLKAGADPNTTQTGGETALMTAARTGSVPVLKALLAAGADVNAKESAKGQTALMWAAAENNADATAELVKAGADINARSRPMQDLGGDPGDMGFTALLFAARADQVDSARVLLDAGVSPDSELPDGTSALVLAITSGQFRVASLMLDRKANPNSQNQGWAALHQMSFTRRPNRGLNTVAPVVRGDIDSLTLVRKLVASGADVNAQMTKEIPSTNFHGRNNLRRIGATPFLLAAHRVDLPLMRLLLDLGADPTIPTKSGVTSLMAAAGVGIWFPGESPGTPTEIYDAVKMCMDLGGDPKAVDGNGDTALHGAAYWDAPKVIKLLVDAGARLDIKNKKGWTPLRIADGVAITASLHVSPESAAFLRELMAQQGLEVPAPGVLGDDGREGQLNRKSGESIIK